MQTLKKIITIIGILAILLLPSFAQAQTVAFPNRGGTGTSTAPSFGQILVGNSIGTYNLYSTSTLGLPQFSDLSNYILTSAFNGLFDSRLSIKQGAAFSTTSANYWGQIQGYISSQYFTSSGTSLNQNTGSTIQVGNIVSTSTALSSFAGPVQYGSGAAQWYEGQDTNGNWGVSPTVSGTRLTNPFLTVTGSQYIGVSTQSPDAPLSVMAGDNFSQQAVSSAFDIASSSAGHATTTIYTTFTNGETDIGSVGTGNTFAALAPTVSGLKTTNVTATGNLWLNASNIGIIWASVGSFNPGIIYRNSTSNIEFLPATSIASVGRMFYSTAGNLGLGTSSPFAKLSISLNANDTVINRTPFLIASSTGGVSTSTLVIVTSNGYVGIGTSTPWTALSVEGTSTLGNNAIAGSFTSTSTIATSTFADGINLTGGCFQINGSCLTPGGGSGGGGTNMFATATLPTNAIFTNTGQNVGIGSSTPNAPLSIMAGANYAQQAISPVIQVGSTTAGTATTTTFDLWSNGELDIGKAGTGSVFSSLAPTTSGINTSNYQGTGNFWLNGTNLGIIFASAGTFQPAMIYRNATGNIEWLPSNSTVNSASRMFYGSTANLGLGSSSPLYKLTVQLNAADVVQNIDPFGIASSTGGISTTTEFVVKNNGNIGIGTSSPGTILSIGNTGANTINISAISTSTFGSGINLGSGCFSVNSVCIGNSSTGASSTLLSDTNTFSGNDYFNNNVGFGTTSPQFPLDIQRSGSDTLNLQSNTSFVEFQGKSYRNSSVSHVVYDAISARGTSAAPIPLNDNDAVNSIRGEAYMGVAGGGNNGDGTNEVADISISASGNQSVSNAGGQIVFSTTQSVNPAATEFLDKRLFIGSNDNIGIGTGSINCAASSTCLIDEKTGVPTQIYIGSVNGGLGNGGASLLSYSTNVNIVPGTSQSTVPLLTVGGSLSTTTFASNGNIGIGSTTPGTYLSLGNTGQNAINLTPLATSTFGTGINLTSGCFSINGSCLVTNSGTVTSVNGNWPITSSGGGSPTLSFGGLSTSSQAVVSNLPYFTGPNTFGNVATSAPTISSPLTTSGTPGALVGGSGFTIGCQTASGSQAGCLASTDWTTFNGKQAAGNYITALTGDISASGPGSSAATLATVNGNVGSFTYPNITVNGKGLVTAVSNGTAPVTSVTATWPVVSSGGTTPNITYIGLSTTSNLVVGQVPYSTGVNTFGQEATGTITCSGSTSCGGGSYVLGSNLVITGSSVSGYPFNVSPNSTTTLVGLNGGVDAYASSTIGNGTTATGLTINGGATTTGQSYFAGNVGVGSTTPGAPLEVAGGVGSADILQITRQTSGQANTWGASISSSFTGAVGTLMLRPNTVTADISLTGSLKSNTPQLMIKGSTGNVGIGTTTELARLDVVGANNITTPLFQVSSVSSFATTTQVIVTNAGNVGIGTTSPITALAVAGTATVNNIVATSSIAMSTITNFEGAMNALDFPGSDVGVKANAAYAALGSNGGVVAITRPGNYSFSTEIQFNTNNKPALLLCAAGVTLTWTGTATSTQINTGDTTIPAATYGVKGCTYFGSAGNSVAIEIGGTNGAPNTIVDDNSISNFANGVVTGNNVWQFNMDRNYITSTPQAFIAEGVSNSGEGFRLWHNTFSECYVFPTVVTSQLEKCVYFPNSSTANLKLDDNSFDDAGLFVEDGNTNVSMDGGHLENSFVQGVGRYTPITFAPTSTGNGKMSVKSVTLYNDATTTPKSFNQAILFGGPLTIQDISIANNHSIVMPSVASAYNTGHQSLISSGVTPVPAGTFTAIATSSITWQVDAQNNLISANAPFNGITMQASDGTVGHSGYALWITSGHNLISSQDDPIGGLNSPTAWPVMINNPNSTNSSSTGIGFSVSNTINGAIGGGIGFQRQGSGSFGDLFFATENSGGTMFERMRITNNGAVGISTTSPYALFSLQGNSLFSNDLMAIATSSGNLVAGYDSDGHPFTSGYAPSITGGATNGTVVGDDARGTITTGTSVSSVTLNFSKSYAKTPTCNVSDDSTVSVADISSISTSAVTFSLSVGLTGGHLYYSCGYHK